MNEVVVTGYSVTTPLGNSIPEFTRRMLGGESGVVNIRGKIVADNFPVPYAAPVEDTLGLPPLSDNQYSLEAEIVLSSLLKETLADLPQGIKIDGLIYGTLEGGAKFGNVQDAIRAGRLTKHNLDSLYSEHSLTFLQNHLLKANYGNLTSQNVICEYNTCITGATVIGHAMQRIRHGHWNRALVATYEIRIRDWQLMALHLLGALSTANVPPPIASRPFTKSRSGFVKGEGAGMILLESQSAAEQRGARILGRIAGFAQTSDQWRLTDGREDSMGAVRAISGAIQDAGLEYSQIEYINAHGTSTPMNDKLETQAIKSIFGKTTTIPISSLKSQIGHSNNSCGMIEAIATLIMLEKQMIAPTINYVDPDPDCDLDYVPNFKRELKFNSAISNSFGFGGANACLVLQRGTLT